MDYKKFILIFVCIFLMPMSAFGAVYPVSWDGDGETVVDGDTFCSGTTCQPGDIIEITSTSTDMLTLQDLTGSSGSNIIIRNSSAGVATLSADVSYAIRLINCHYFTITGTGTVDTYGIKITDGNSFGILSGSWITPSTHMSFDHLWIDLTNAGGEGIAFFLGQVQDNMTNIDGLHISYCKIENTNREALYLGVDYANTGYMANVEIDHNIFNNIGWDVIQVRVADHGTNSVHDNVATDWGLDPKNVDPNGYHRACQVHISFVGSIYNNKCINETVTSSYLYGLNAVSSVNGFNNTNIDMYNNVIDLNGQGYAAVGPEWDTTFSTWLVRQNTLANCGLDCIRGSINKTMVIRDNILCSPANNYILSGGDITDTNNLKDSCSNVDFTNLSGNDFSLASNSGARDNGSSSGYPSYDAINNSRPLGSAVDQGAYEYAFLVHSVSPSDGSTGVNISAIATWDYEDSINDGSDVIDDVDVWLDKAACSTVNCDGSLVSDDDADKSYDMSPLDENSTYCLSFKVNSGALQGACQEYEFITTDVIPPATGLAPAEVDPTCANCAPAVITTNGTPAFVGN